MAFDALTVSMGIGVLAIAYAAVLALRINGVPLVNRRMLEVADAIRQGALAFLNRQYSTIAVITVLIAAVIYFADKPDLAWKTAVAFLLGAFLSSVAGYVSMLVSVSANGRTAQAAEKEGLNAALAMAFRGGSVMGFSVVALSLLGVGFLYWWFGSPELIVGFGFGASLVALFAQLGGGIYTKAADVGADLVGKVEKGIPEDDPRNPAVIADNVGDNVGDCAGRGADLFESTAAENIGAMILGLALAPAFGAGAVLFPIASRAMGLVASFFGSFAVRVKEGQDPMDGLNRGFYVTTLLSAVGFWFLTQWFLGGNLNLYYASLIGLATGLIIVWITNYYTSHKYKPVREIAKASESGHAVNIITGLAIGMETTFLPAIVLSVAIFASYSLGGLYGMAVATMGILATTAFVLAMDGFGPISDNAGGIAEMAKADPKARKTAERLDAAGNTTKALTKGYAMASAVLAAFLLFAAYLEVINLHTVDLAKPPIFIGLFLGAMVAYLFSALAIRAVGRAAFDIVGEVRRQFREIKGIMTGKAKPDYAKCVDIATTAALKGMVLPGLLTVASPLAIGFLLGGEAAAAFIMGAIVSGVLLAVMMFNAGGAWDNAKKYIEEGHLGGKGSPAHAAAVTGDTVGDPLKDTAGPSLHILVKLVNTITLVFAPLFPK
jgi:K(+)-stimulated pyrophosphate-energized sodium pump